jgi:hypothetical protein
MLLKNTKTLVLTAAVGALVGFGGFTSVNAQNTYQAPQPAQQKMNVSSEKLEEFAEVQTTIGQIEQEYMTTAQQLKDQAQLGALQQQTNQKMVQAIEQSDLNRQEYDMISQAIRADEGLKNRYLQIMQK